MDKTNLILEGGGMRGVYTSGVLDAFLEKKVFINNIMAVSAGCYNALSYLSQQKGRSFQVSSKYLKDNRFISMRRLILEGSAIDNDFIFEEVFKKLEPFDYEKFKKNVGDFFVVSTDIKTGNALYHRINDLQKDAEYIKASTALPMFTNIVSIDDLKLLDGGVADSIPIAKSLEMGYKNNILILTRPGNFIMEKNKLILFLKMKYKKYPELIKKLENRYIQYNETLQLIKKLEKERKIIVIRPQKDLGIGRVEKNKEKMDEIYRLGYEDGLKNINNIKCFLERDCNYEKTKNFAR